MQIASERASETVYGHGAFPIICLVADRHRDRIESKSTREESSRIIIIIFWQEVVVVPAPPPWRERAEKERAGNMSGEGHGNCVSGCSHCRRIEALEHDRARIQERHCTSHFGVQIENESCTLPFTAPDIPEHPHELLFPVHAP